MEPAFRTNIQTNTHQDRSALKEKHIQELTSDPGFIESTENQNIEPYPPGVYGLHRSNQERKFFLQTVEGKKTVTVTDYGFYIKGDTKCYPSMGELLKQIPDRIPLNLFKKAENNQIYLRSESEAENQLSKLVLRNDFPHSRMFIFCTSAANPNNMMLLQKLEDGTIRKDVYTYNPEVPGFSKFPHVKDEKCFASLDFIMNDQGLMFEDSIIHYQNLIAERSKQALAKEERTLKQAQELEKRLSLQTAKFVQEVRNNPAFSTLHPTPKQKFGLGTFFIHPSEEQNVFQLRIKSFAQVDTVTFKATPEGYQILSSSIISLLARESLSKISHTLVDLMQRIDTAFNLEFPIADHIFAEEHQAFTKRDSNITKDELIQIVKEHGGQLSFTPYTFLAGEKKKEIILATPSMEKKFWYFPGQGYQLKDDSKSPFYPDLRSILKAYQIDSELTLKVLEKALIDKSAQFIEQIRNSPFFLRRILTDPMWQNGLFFLVPDKNADPFHFTFHYIKSDLVPYEYHTETITIRVTSEGFQILPDATTYPKIEDAILKIKEGFPKLSWSLNEQKKMIRSGFFDKEATDPSAINKRLQAYPKAFVFSPNPTPGFITLTMESREFQYQYIMGKGFQEIDPHKQGNTSGPIFADLLRIMESRGLEAKNSLLFLENNPEVLKRIKEQKFLSEHPEIIRDTEPSEEHPLILTEEDSKYYLMLYDPVNESIIGRSFTSFDEYPQALEDIKTKRSHLSMMNFLTKELKEYDHGNIPKDFETDTKFAGGTLHYGISGPHYYCKYKDFFTGQDVEAFLKLYKPDFFEKIAEYQKNLKEKMGQLAAEEARMGISIPPLIRQPPPNSPYLQIRRENGYYIIHAKDPITGATYYKALGSLEAIKEEIALLNFKKDFQEIGFFKRCTRGTPLTINKTQTGYILEAQTLLNKMNFEFNNFGEFYQRSEKKYVLGPKEFANLRSVIDYFKEQIGDFAKAGEKWRNEHHYLYNQCVFFDRKIRSPEQAIEKLNKTYLRYKGELQCVVFYNPNSLGNYFVAIRYANGHCKCHAMDYNPATHNYSFLGKNYDNPEEVFKTLKEIFQDFGSVQQPVEASIVRSEGSGRKTLNKDGQAVTDTTSGHARMRISYLQGDQFEINIVGQPEEIKQGEYVSTSYDPIAETASLVIRESDGQIYKIQVSVQDMSDRWLISKDKIIDYASNGNLDFLLIRKESKLRNLPKLLNDYQNLFDKHFAKAPEGLVKGLNARQMMKIVRAYHRAELQDERITHYLSISDPRNKYYLSNFEAVIQRQKSALKVIRLNHSVHLGSGKFGQVFKVSDLDDEIQALKVAHNQKVYESFHVDNPEIRTQKAYEDLHNEVKILKEVHKNGLVEGIEDPPTEIIVIEPKAVGVPRIAVLKKLFEGNVRQLIESLEFIKTSLETKLDCCEQILKGGAVLEELKILHLDQKAENVFYDVVAVNGKKRYLMKIADFGGAKKVGSPTVSTTTPRYWPLEERGRETFKTDVYQRGVLIYEILTQGFRPHGEIEVRDKSKPGYPGYPDFSTGFDSEPLRWRHISKPYIDLIERMCDPNPAKRPTAKEAEQEWKRIAAGGAIDFIPKKVERVA